MSLPVYDRQADSTAIYLDEAKAYLPEWDWEILCYRADDPTGALDMWDTHSNRFFKNLVHYVSLGGIIPSEVYRAKEEGKLFVWSSDEYPWACHLPRANEGAWSEDKSSFNPASDLKDAIILYRRLNISERKAIKFLQENFNVKLMNINDMYSQKVAESEICEENIFAYIKSMGGKLTEDGWYAIKFKKYTTVEVKLEKGVWYYREGTQEHVLRNYHSISGIVPKSKHAIMLVVLNYLLTSRTEEDLRGRRAFMSNVFVDKVYVGFSHKLLDKAIANKLGTLLLGADHVACFTKLAKDTNLVRAAKAYEALGYSVFMHKGAKYIIVEAECAGFYRTDDKTQVGWFADKQAKLTGRALFLVPTAALYEDDED